MFSLCFSLLVFILSLDRTQSYAYKQTSDKLLEEIDNFKLNYQIQKHETSQKFTWVCPKAQLVLSPLAGNCKHVVLGVSSFTCRVFQIYSKSVLYFRQAVYLVQPQPKLAIQVTKAILVVGPAAVEINGAIQSLLEHCPPPTGCCLVTEHIKGAWAIRVDRINTADSLTGFELLSTVLTYWEKVDEAYFRQTSPNRRK